MDSRTSSIVCRFWLNFTGILIAGLLLAACDQVATPTLPRFLPTLTPAQTSFTPQPIQSTLIVLSPTRSPTSLPSPTPSPSPFPTLTPSSTPIPGSPTLSPTVTLTGTKTLIPTATRWVWVTWTPIPTKSPTITLTPTPPPAYLRFLRPGAFSKVLSPIQVEAGVTPGEDGLILLDLIGEDGRILTTQRLNYSEYLNRSIAIAPKIEFSIPGVAETARLVLSVNDKLGRKLALVSLDLVLFSIGNNDVYPALEQFAPYLIRAPFPDQVITGGILQVRGLARPVNNNPVIFELLNEQNQVIASGKTTVPMPSGNISHNPFTIDLTYTIKASIRARLLIRQESSNRIPGTVALWSVPILLEP